MPSTSSKPSPLSMRDKKPFVPSAAMSFLPASAPMFGMQRAKIRWMGSTLRLFSMAANRFAQDFSPKPSSFTISSACASR